jgi:hypothetical protein
MSKPIEQLTDEELEERIKLHESEIQNDQATKHPTPALLEGIKAKKCHLLELYPERNRRRKKGS